MRPSQISKRRQTPNNCRHGSIQPKIGHIPAHQTPNFFGTPTFHDSILVSFRFKCMIMCTTMIMISASCCAHIHLTTYIYPNQLMCMFGTSDVSLQPSIRWAIQHSNRKGWNDWSSHYGNSLVCHQCEAFKPVFYISFECTCTLWMNIKLNAKELVLQHILWC